MSARQKQLTQVVTIMLLAYVVDYYSTVFGLGLQAGLVEGNPLVAHIATVAHFPWVKLGVPLVAGTYVIAWVFLSKNEAYNDWIVFTLLCINNVAQVFLINR
jgi:H+/gluconate symporter-like permease